MVYSSGVDITIDPPKGCSNVARPTTNSCCEAPPCSALVALWNWQRVKGGCDLENLGSFWRRITCQKYTTAYFATSSGQFISWSVRPLFPQLSWVPGLPYGFGGLIATVMGRDLHEATEATPILGGELPTNRGCGLVHPNSKWIHPLQKSHVNHWGELTQKRAVGSEQHQVVTIPKSSPFSWCKSSPGHGRLRGKSQKFSSLICPTHQLNLQF